MSLFQAAERLPTRCRYCPCPAYWRDEHGWLCCDHAALLAARTVLTPIEAVKDPG